MRDKLARGTIIAGFFRKSDLYDTTHIRTTREVPVVVEA